MSKKDKKIRSALLWGGILFFLILASGYVLIFSSYFKIKEVNISGAEKIPQTDILEITYQVMSGRWKRFIPQDSLISFSILELKTRLKEKYPIIKEVNISKKIPSFLNVFIQERQSVLVFCSKEQDNVTTKCFYLDEDGFVFDQAPEVYGGLLISLVDNSKRGIKIRDTAIDKKIISFISETSGFLDKFLGLNLLNWQIESLKANDLAAATSEGWRIFFNPASGSSDQVQALKTVLEEKIKSQRSQLEYIDLRVENRVYYKFKK